MKSGKLDRHITIERSAETIDDYGRTATTWSTIATVRAEILQATTAEFLRSYGEAETSAIAFRIRAIPGVEIRTSDRVAYAGEAFNLVEIREIGRRRWLELRAERITS